jgi:alpha-amylase/alpha-mannosidase (GH57 family)
MPPPTPTAAPPTPVPPTPAPEPLYLSLVWHQHQPLYYKDPETGIYTRPWVRVHATKDYYDMAAILEQYSDVHVTFNLTPVLIRQLDDFAAGAKDLYWVLAEKPAGSLTDEEKRFILRRFFDANWTQMIGRFPRYKELLDKRKGTSDEEIEAALQTFSEQDFRDLQVWFNLAWFDPDFLAEEPLRSLVEKGRGFSEADKQVLFDKAREVIRAVIPKHRELQDRGQIEVITTPYAHPILPLIYNSDLAAVGDPAADLPERFSYPQDARAHLTRSVEVYEAHFGRKPRGLWPAEGAVAQDIVKLVADAGYTWMASGEHVLAKSLGMDGFTRDSREVVQEADALYRPYYVQFRDGPPVGIVFRDLRLSDLIGFEYSGTPGEQAAADLMARLEAIRARLEAQGAQGPHLVSIILDGENAWEYYPNDGKAFLHALYRQLSESKTVRTITPSEFLKKFPEQRKIENLWPGAWFSPDYGTWIGEPEEKQAWEVLRRVREHLAQYDFYKKKQTSPENLARALDFMYLAEGSDWFWWYGADQDSGVDEYFDTAFRALLAEVYKALGEPVPDFVQVPIIPERPVPPVRGVAGPFTPQTDGVAGAEEWAQAGVHEVRGGAQARAEDVVEAFYYGYDARNLHFRVDLRRNLADLGEGARVGIYLALPRQPYGHPFTRLSAEQEAKTLLGFQAGYAVEVAWAAGKATGQLWRVGRWGTWESVGALEQVGAEGKTVEVSVPLDLLGDAEPGDVVSMRAVASEPARDLALAPAGGPAQLVLPDLGLAETILEVADPQGDDHGPGTYTYPTDKVFEPGVFDLAAFNVSHDDKNLIFKFRLYGPINNVWGSGINLSVQTFDVYIDVDPGAGTGARLLLEGRNAALEPGYGWDYALWVEGWHQKVLKPDEKGKPVELPGSPLKVIVDAPNRQVTIRVPKDLFGKEVAPTRWAYVGVLLSQEGFPSPGVRRVRDVKPQAEQWRIGGGPDDTNHTRILDVAWPEGATPTQEEFLSRYRPSQEKNVDALTPDDFAQVPVLKP